MILLPARLQPFAKAVAAFLTSFIGLLSTAVASSTPHTIGAITTPAWLLIASGTVGIAGTVLGVSNVSSSSTSTTSGGQTTVVQHFEAANLPPNMTAYGDLPDPQPPAPAKRAVRKTSGKR